jgi:sarcosine oxidase delta subunit
MNGLRSGYGRLIQDNGLIYEGQWSENWPHGDGCVRYPSKLEDIKCDVFCGTFNKS